jgi:hypothetical protein
MNGYWELGSIHPPTCFISSIMQQGLMKFGLVESTIKTKGTRCIRKPKLRGLESVEEDLKSMGRKN